MKKILLILTFVLSACSNTPIKPSETYLSCPSTHEKSPSNTTAQSIFGLKLGQPLEANECPKKLIGKRVFYSDSTEICFEKTNNTMDCVIPINENVTLRFPYTNKPEILSGTLISAKIIDGNLEWLGFSTSGASTQIRNYDLLINKFGKPASVIQSPLQNRMGAQYNSIFAVWQLDKISVEFMGIAESINRGSVFIGTKKGIDANKQALEQLRSNNIPL